MRPDTATPRDDVSMAHTCILPSPKAAFGTEQVLRSYSRQGIILAWALGPL